MNKQELSQLKFLNKEIDLLKKQISEIKPGYVMDLVTGSSKHYPYTAHSIKIEGIDIKEYDRKIKRLKNQLQRRLDEVMDKRAEIEEFIETLDDSMTRQIIALRYISGFSWEQVTSHMGSGYTVDCIKKHHERFLKNI